MTIRFLVYLLAAAASVMTPLSSAALDTQFQHEWSTKYGGSGADMANGIASDGQENAIITGSFTGEADFGGGLLTSAGNTDVFLAKYDAAGTHLWSRRFGSVGADIGYGTAVDTAGNIYVTGYFSGTVDFGGAPLVSAGSYDVFVVSLAANGTHRWSRRFGSASSDLAYAMTVTHSGNIIVAGAFTGTVVSGIVMQLDPNGVPMWSAHVDLGSYEFGRGVAVDEADNVYVIDEVLNGLIETEQAFAYALKFDSAGSLDWSRVAISGSDSSPKGIAVDSDGDVIVVGTLMGCGAQNSGCRNGFIAKLSTAGDPVWSRRFPDISPNVGNQRPEPLGVVTDPDGNITVAGYIVGSADLGGGPIGDTGDVFLARFDELGNHQASSGFPGTGTGWPSGGFPFALAPTGADGLLMAGRFTDTIDFGGGPLSTGSIDAFVARFDIEVSVSVAISSFTATAAGNAVELRGAFRSDIAVTAVNVYRDDRRDGPLTRIESVFGVHAERFEYTDLGVRPGQFYRYQIGVVDGDGEFFSPVAVVTTIAPVAAIHQNVPNPFNPTTTIPFVMAERGRATITIYDTHGRVVRTLLDEIRGHGNHEIAWDGRDDHGTAVGSGVYFYRLRAAKFADSKKMLLLK